MFDRSLLAESIFDFVVIADTHHLRVDASAATEFASRRLQADRAQTALRLAAWHNCDPVIHLGDLVQAYPEFEGFDEAMAQAMAGINQCGLGPIIVPGNHDVGDKPDPTMPTHPVSAQSLAWFEQHVGPSWSSFDRHGVHFVIVNSQILNSDLPQTDEQRQWLEDDLSANAAKRVFMFLHMPPYLAHESEPGLGHYDNIDKPDRRWLMNLVKEHQVELLYAAHVHWRFFDRIGATRYFVAPSPSFTRPGFGHMFTSGPAAEQGRDDAPKLGFFLTRVFDDHTDIHLVRTNGLTCIASDIESGKLRHLLTRQSTTLPHSPLGVTLQHPLAPMTHVPRAWPSNVRQPVRNDYPLLSCVELGVKYVRVPCTDLVDADQRRWLHILRDEQVAVIATSLWGDGHNASAMIQRWGNQIDAWEFQVPGGTPPDELVETIRKFKIKHEMPVVLSPVIANERVAGKQHLRTRLGYRLDELESLAQRLAHGHTAVDRVLCQIEADGDALDDFTRIGAATNLQTIGASGTGVSPVNNPARNLQTIGAVDVLLQLNSTDEQCTLRRAAGAMFAASVAPSSRLFIEPLIDLDRTMDTSLGLLDTLCNPRPAFGAVRCLNTILHRRRAAAADSHGVGTPQLQHGILQQDDRLYCLLDDAQKRDDRLSGIAEVTGPTPTGALTPTGSLTPTGARGSLSARIFHLADGLVQDCAYNELKRHVADIDPAKVLLVECLPTRR